MVRWWVLEELHSGSGSDGRWAMGHSESRGGERKTGPALQGDFSTWTGGWNGDGDRNGGWASASWPPNPSLETLWVLVP